MIKIFVCCLFFVFFQSLCMTEQQNLDDIRKIPIEIIDKCMEELDWQSHMHFLLTCKKFYSKWMTYSHPNDYTKAMVNCARDYFKEANENKKKQINETFNSLIKGEGPRNKKDRQYIENFFKKIKITEQWKTIDIYGQIYKDKNLFWFPKHDIKQIITEHTAIARLIFNQGYKHNLNDLDDRGYSKLRNAICFEKIDYVKALISLEGIVNLNIQNKIDGEIPLHSAVFRNDYNVVKFLLACPTIDPNIQNKYMWTPLRYAVIHKASHRIIKLLCEDGRVNPNISDKYGFTPYSEAKNAKIKKILGKYTSFWGKYGHWFLSMRDVMQFAVLGILVGLALVIALGIIIAKDIIKIGKEI